MPEVHIPSLHVIVSDGYEVASDFIHQAECSKHRCMVLLALFSLHTQGPAAPVPGSQIACEMPVGTRGAIHGYVGRK